MPETTYTYARAHLAELWDRAVRDREPVVIHRRGAEDVALISAEELSSMQETLHLLASPENGIRLLTALKRAYAREAPATNLRALWEELGLYDEGEDAERAARRQSAS